MDENNKFDVVGTNIAEKATMIWNVADMLRGPFKPHEYGLVILPMTVVKRFHDCLLPTHKEVLEQYEKVKNFAVIDGFLTKASGYQFYNISKYTFEFLLADPENIEANFRDYLNGFSANVQDVLAKFDFDNIIRRMVESNTLYLVIKEFNSQKGYLGPDKISAVDCGYIFEDLVKRFSESFGEEAGAHFTSRDIIYLMTDLLLSDARIFQRKEGDKINIPVSCITDRDVMPECAPAICIDEKYEDRDNWPKKNRKWKVESEIKDKEKYIQEIEKKANGQNVKTFIPEQWTLEYELAANGLGEEMLQTIATMLAEKIQDKEKNEEKKAELLEKYRKEYNEYQNKEAKASYVYSFFSHKLVSKAEFAQQFSFDLENIFKGKQVEEIVTVLPNYLVKAIEYVTTKSEGI